MNKIDFNTMLRLDMSDECLWRGDEHIPLTAKTFSILSYLASRPNQLVTKHELLEAIWPTTYVVEDVIKHYIAELRRLLGDSAGKPRFIENVRGRGYRFIGYIKIEKTIDSSNIQPIISVSSDPATESEVEKIASLKEIPIAVLPFVNLSGDPRQKYFADGITADVITDLSRFNELRVVTVSPVIDHWKKSPSVRDVAKDLGVDYILSGGIRRDHDRLRVTVQLIDAIEGYYLWTEAYDCKLTVGNIIDIQVDIAQKIVVAVANPGSGALSLVGKQRILEIRAGSLSEYNGVLLAHHYCMIYNKETHKVARDSLEEAIKRNPEYANGWAWLSHLYGDEEYNLFNPRPGAWERAFEAAIKAVELDPANQKAQVEIVNHFLKQGKDNQVLLQAEKALALNPNNATAIADLSIWLVGAGFWDKGYELAMKATQLDPHNGIPYFPIFRYHYNRGDYESALNAILKVNHFGAFNYWQYVAAAYAQLGFKTKAQAAAAKVLELNPDYIDHAYEHCRKFSHSDEYVEHVMVGLRKAGLEIPLEKGM